MPLFAGQVLLPDQTRQGWLQVEGGRIQASGWEEPPDIPVATGWIVPAPVNAHTHSADTALRELPGRPTELGPLVGPGGWKHRHLAAADADTLRGGVGRLAGEMAAIGTAAFLDFREGGVDGVRIMQDLDLEVAPHWFGRPSGASFDEDEADVLLQMAHGIGLSAMRDLPGRVPEQWAQAAREARRPFALHVSEAAREPMDRALSMDPSFVVHACQARRVEFEHLAAGDVPVVVCPRSNRAFGLRPPVDLMLQEGVCVALGTDNGMLQDGDLWQEAARLQHWFPEVSTDDLLRMATYNGRGLAGLEAPSLRPGAPADWVVLPALPWAPAPSDKPKMAPRQEGS